MNVKPCETIVQSVLVGIHSKLYSGSACHQILNNKLQ